jgi:hypothetical protein
VRVDQFGLRSPFAQELSPHRAEVALLEWRLLYLPGYRERISVYRFRGAAPFRSVVLEKRRGADWIVIAHLRTHLGRGKEPMNLLNQFLNGAIMMGFVVAALFFLRFHRRTRERLFAIFAASFFVLAAERIILACVPPEAEFRPYVYVIRLIAFLLIIAAIVDKNRGAKQKRPSVSEHESNHVR